MSKNQVALVLVLALISAFAGGALSSQPIPSKSAAATFLYPCPDRDSEKIPRYVKLKASTDGFFQISGENSVGANELPRDVTQSKGVKLSGSSAGLSYANNTGRDAEERFFRAVRIHKAASDKARSLEGKIDSMAFQIVIIDLDAAIPGLEGVMLGRALVLKGDAIYWLYLAKLTESRVYTDVPPNPLWEEGLSSAVKGRQILAELGSSVDLPWADSVVQHLAEVVREYKH